ncbi:MAG: alpha/beta hydrolase [Telluria sp.]
MKNILLAAACALSLHAAAATVTPKLADGAPYAVPFTTVHTLHASALKRDYQLYVALPAGYDPKGPALPVIFTTDADYSFPLIQAVAGRIARHSDAIAPFILVGLSYGIGDTGEFSRRRDYTPTMPHERYTSDMPGRAPEFGGAEAFRRFLAEQALPFVATHYRADMARSMFVGHSYGALLGAHILLTAPGMFTHYVISSPSLWFDDGVMFRREKDYAAGHKDLKANVYFAVGEFEAAKKGDRRFNQDTDMVRDLRQFDVALRSHHFPGLRTQLRVLPGHDHLTGFPDMITDALKAAFPGKRARG